jgi:hypothetical protein
VRTSEEAGAAARWQYLREETGSMPGAGTGYDETVFTEIKILDRPPGILPLRLFAISPAPVARAISR